MLFCNTYAGHVHYVHKLVRRKNDKCNINIKPVIIRLYAVPALEPAKNRKQMTFAHFAITKYIMVTFNHKILFCIYVFFYMVNFSTFIS